MCSFVVGSETRRQGKQLDHMSIEDVTVIHVPLLHADEYPMYQGILLPILVSNLSLRCPINGVTNAFVS
jgi:hypothetical protein